MKECLKIKLSEVKNIQIQPPANPSRKNSADLYIDYKNGKVSFIETADYDEIIFTS